MYINFWMHFSVMETFYSLSIYLKQNGDLCVNCTIFVSIIYLEKAKLSVDFNIIVTYTIIMSFVIPTKTQK